nr:protein FAR1-related sequence 5-like [Tanacetum cinerariifolium]
NNDVEFQPSPNDTPYWVPDVPEDEKPKRGPTRAHRLKVTLVGGYDKVRGTSTDYCNFRRAVNLFIGDRDAQMYGYKFVPFTGIDHNQKCVTFGAALLLDETTESLCWMLEAFLKTHKKQPPFAVTDQDDALRNTIVKMFPESHHRLCMWHITQKLPGKFMLCFEYAMEKQRYTHVLDNASSGSNPSMFIELPFEKHASDVYTPAIHKSLYACTHIRSNSDANVETCIIRHRDKRSNTVIDVTKKLEDKTQVPNVEPNKDDLYSELLDVSIPNKVVIKTPKSIFRSKGTRRIKSAAEIGKAKTIARSNMKVPFKRRTCSASGGKGHNKATCKGCSACGKPVDDEDECDNEDEFDDEDEGDTENELADEDEVDEEYESDEE